MARLKDFRVPSCAYVATCEGAGSAVGHEQVERGTMQLVHNGGEEVAEGAGVSMDLIPGGHLDVEGELGITATSHAHIESGGGDFSQLVQRLQGHKIIRR